MPRTYWARQKEMKQAKTNTQIAKVESMTMWSMALRSGVRVRGVGMTMNPSELRNSLFRAVEARLAALSLNKSALSQLSFSNPFNIDH